MTTFLFFWSSHGPYRMHVGKKWRPQEMCVVMFSFLMDFTFDLYVFHFWSGVRWLIWRCPGSRSNGPTWIGGSRHWSRGWRKNFWVVCQRRALQTDFGGAPCSAPCCYDNSRNMFVNPHRGSFVPGLRIAVAEARNKLHWLPATAEKTSSMASENDLVTFTESLYFVHFKTNSIHSLDPLDAIYSG